jgi:hypothetical protein
MSSLNQNPGQQNQNPGQKPVSSKAAARSRASSRIRAVRARTPIPSEIASSNLNVGENEGGPAEKRGFFSFAGGGPRAPS